MNNKISKEKYNELFSIQTEDNSNKHENALERAWKNRDFEIEMYWKRATYFWVFLATTFAGYFALQTVDLSKVADKIDIYLLNIVVICLGICFSVSWFLVNKGSKKWQENWEAHIDLLEDKITGPIYKVVRQEKGYNYSVSRINLYVSGFVIGIWFILLIHKICQLCIPTNEFSSHLKLFISSIVVTGTIFYVIFIVCGGLGETRTNPKRHNFVLRDSEIEE